MITLLLRTSLLLGVALSAMPANPGGEPDAARDIRPPSDNSALYVVFCARNLIPGHAFVVLGKDDDKKQLCSAEAWGYYPKDGKAVLGTVPAELANEYLKPAGIPSDACRLILKVNSEQFNAVDRVRRRWAEKKDYTLLDENCVAFTRDVAKALGLRVPSGLSSKHPQIFVRKLIEQNK